MKKTIRLCYPLKSKLEFVFDDSGDILSFKINDVDLSDNGDAIENGLAAVAEAGFYIQGDISEAFEEARQRRNIFLDEDYLYVSQRDAEILEAAGE